MVSSMARIRTLPQPGRVRQPSSLTQTRSVIGVLLRLTPMFHLVLHWIAPSTTAIAITGHNGPVLATTTRIGFQAEISALQEAGTDYETELRYIATPVF
jgi:hypothetical protein